MSTLETYLGDGLYAHVDDAGQIMLRAPRMFDDHWVALEPSVLEAFLRYVGERTGRGPFACRHGAPLTERCELCTPEAQRQP